MEFNRKQATVESVLDLTHAEITQILLLVNERKAKIFGSKN